VNLAVNGTRKPPSASLWRLGSVSSTPRRLGRRHSEPGLLFTEASDGSKADFCDPNNGQPPLLALLVETTPYETFVLTNELPSHTAHARKAVTLTFLDAGRVTFVRCAPMQD